MASFSLQNVAGWHGPYHHHGQVAFDLLTLIVVCLNALDRPRSMDAKIATVLYRDGTVSRRYLVFCGKSGIMYMLNFSSTAQIFNLPKGYPRFVSSTDLSTDNVLNVSGRFALSHTAIRAGILLLVILSPVRRSFLKRHIPCRVITIIFSPRSLLDFRKMLPFLRDYYYL